jgi:hypothetical protein
MEYFIMGEVADQLSFDAAKYTANGEWVGKNPE